MPEILGSIVMFATNMVATIENCIEFVDVVLPSRLCEINFEHDITFNLTAPDL